jgi:hypothetical protein
MENAQETHVETGNLVGIIPVSGRNDHDFQMPWPDCLTPIAPDYTLIESSVVECAYAGCKAIYIVINDDTAPIVRKRIGDFCGDPVWSDRTCDPIPHESKRRIPIFYIPLHAKDRGRRDSLSWSVIHGALTAFKLSSGISRWFSPSKYYVSFPHSYFDPSQIRSSRRLISGPKNFYLSYNGETVKDGHFLSFTFTKDEWIEFRRIVRTGTGIRPPGSKFGDTAKLPPKERYSARWFDVDKVFAPLELGEMNELEIEGFYNIRSWKEYINMLAGTMDNPPICPKDSVLYAYGHNKVAIDTEEK